MAITEMLLKEMDREAATTRKMLEKIPEDKYDWQPHPKSMSIRQLSTHIAELPAWVAMVLTTSELDFAANPYQPIVLNNNKDLFNYFEESLENGRSHLAAVTDEYLQPDWTLRSGDVIYNVSSKGEMIRTTFSQIIHHRAQLGVFLRLLNVPIPGSYGPSADEMKF